MSNQTEQASAARLTAIANSPSPLYVHGDDLREDARAVLAQIDTLRQDRDAARAALTVAHDRLTMWMGNDDGDAIDLVCDVADGLDTALKGSR